MRSNFLLLLITFLVFFSSNSQEYQSLIIPKTLTEDANASVREEQTVIDLSETGLKVSMHKVITVFNKMGNRFVQTQAYYDDDRDIRNIEAHIYDALGRKIKTYRKRDFQDVSAAGGSTLYQDARILVLDYAPLSYPYTVEYEVEWTSKSTALFPEWNPLRATNLSVAKSEYVINHPESLSLLVKEKNVEGYQVDTEHTPIQLRYSLTSAQALPEEELAPSIDELSPRVMVVPRQFELYGTEGMVSNWEQLGVWMNEHILAGRNALEEETIAEVQRLTQNLSDPEQKARAIYKYVQDNTRYISVQVGIGGFQPEYAEEVDALKYGDCKGLVNYTRALLDAAGIKAYYAHVEAGDQKKNMDPEFPSIGQANHVILYLPLETEEYWLECTSQTVPFGHIAGFTDDRDVLVMMDEGGQIKRTTAYLPTANSQELSAELQLTSDGAISGNFEILTRGAQYDYRSELEKYDQKDQQKYYRESLPWLTDLDLRDMEHTNDKTAVEYIERVAFYSPDYAKAFGNDLMVKFNVLNRNNYIPKHYEDRRFPIAINRGYKDTDNVVIKIPEGYTIGAMPDPFELESEFGSYQIKVESLTDGKIRVSRHLIINQGTYEAAKYDQYRDFRKAVARADNQKMIFTLK
ncbi:DUF3857 domain-containing protein [Croceiramulus getboli]|nr:DUF3857 domain-containing protein [Flavobacteriaceae bacterium YJPT1-3]